MPVTEERFRDRLDQQFFSGCYAQARCDSLPTSRVGRDDAASLLIGSAQRLIDAVEAGSSTRAAARRLQVSASTAVKWVQRKRQTGSVEAKPMHGHPPAKLLPHEDRLLRLVVEEPDLTLRQIGERLAADGIHVSKSCLHTFLWRNRIRLKKDRPRRGTEPARREEAA